MLSLPVRISCYESAFLVHALLQSVGCNFECFAEISMPTLFLVKLSLVNLVL